MSDEVGLPDEWKAIDVTRVVRFIIDFIGAGALLSILLLALMKYY